MLLLMRKFVKFVKSGKKNFYLKLLLFFKKNRTYIIVRDPVACDNHSNRKNTFSLKVAIYIHQKIFPEFSPSQSIFSQNSLSFPEFPQKALFFPDFQVFPGCWQPCDIYRDIRDKQTILGLSRIQQKYQNVSVNAQHEQKKNMKI